jgi:multisubunit Na+/H+ antiporter MnhC subunit
MIEIERGTYHGEEREDVHLLVLQQANVARRAQAVRWRLRSRSQAGEQAPATAQGVILTAVLIGLAVFCLVHC